MEPKWFSNKRSVVTDLDRESIPDNPIADLPNPHQSRPSHVQVALPVYRKTVEMHSVLRKCSKAD